MTRKILIADDSAMARTFVQRCAEIAGLSGESEHAQNGKEALMRASSADLLFMDLNMPEIHGRDVLVALRRSGIETPIIIISSAVNDRVRDELLGLGATSVIAKPFTPVQLMDALSFLEEVA
jgi:two-component system chemotaxis response regulator CheY